MPDSDLRTPSETMPPRPTARHFSSTTTRFAPCSASRSADRGNGRNEQIDTEPMREPSARISSTTSLHRAVDGAERDHDRLGIVGAIRADEAARIAAELLLERRRELRQHRERPQLLVVREVAHLGEGFRADHGADADRLGRVEHLPRLVGRQVEVDLRLARHVDAVVGVGQDEAVHADHDRTRQLLGEAERLDVEVERFLVGLRVELDPPGVAHRHAVGVVVPDVDRRADRPVADGHHDRQARGPPRCRRLRP